MRVSVYVVSKNKFATMKTRIVFFSLFLFVTGLFASQPDAGIPPHQSAHELHMEIHRQGHELHMESHRKAHENALEMAREHARIHQEQINKQGFHEIEYRPRRNQERKGNTLFSRNRMRRLEKTP